MFERMKLQSLPGRRVFVGTSFAAMAASLFSGCCGPQDSQAMAQGGEGDGAEIAALTLEQRDAMTPQQILDAARAGNQRFLEGRKYRRDFLAEQLETAAGQHPAAIVLGCVDSRAPAEIIFNLGIGDVFNCRIAGNIENPDILGSIEFATKLSGAKVILVMGHSACGAVKGSIAAASLGNLTQLLDKIRPAVEATTYVGDRSADNPEFVDAVARRNVELTIANIREKSAVVAELEQAGTIKIAGAFHDLATGRVEFLNA